MAWLLLAIQFLLSALLLFASVRKALRPEDFPAALRLSHVPSPLIRPLSIGIPLIELGLALALVLSSPWSLPIALTATAVLFGVFTVWMAWIRVRHLRVQCGCFGTGNREVGRQTIARNGLVILLATAGALLAGWTESPLPQASFVMVVIVTSISATFALLVALRQVAPHLVVTLEQL